MRRPAWLIPPFAFMLILGIARMLKPDPSGHGTHQALGLPPCLFFAGTGLPCPSCGLTTSFSHLVRLQWSQAFQANPLGPVLFLLFALVAIFSLLEFFGGSTPLRKLLNGQGTGWIYGGVVIYLTVWGGRLMAGIH